MTAERGLVWVTRAAPGAHDTAAALRALGRPSLVAPLIATRTVETPPPFPLAAATAWAFTSATAVRALAGRLDPLQLGLTVFAVGGATAAAARAAGFTRVEDADGDVEALSARLSAAAARGETGVRVLHPRAATVAAPLAGAFGWVVYETHATAAHHAQVRARFAAVAAVLIQSPSAGQALAALAPTLDPANWSRATLHAQSAACAAPLAPADRARARLAPHPRQVDLLATLALASPPPPATDPPRPSGPP